MDFPGEKLVIKLWETLAEKGVGSLLSPWHAKREGKVRNDLRRQELLMLAQAERDAADVRAGRKSLRDDGALVALPAPADDTLQAGAGVGYQIEPTLRLPLAEAAACTTTATEA